MYQWSKFKNIFTGIFGKKVEKNISEVSTSYPAVNQIQDTPISGTINNVGSTTPPPNDEIKKISDQLKYLEKKAEYSLKLSKDAINLVVLGFIALVIVVIGIGYGYLQFVYDNSRSEDYRYNVQEKLNKNTNDFDNLKKDYNNFKDCLKRGGWNMCLNLK